MCNELVNHEQTVSGPHHEAGLAATRRTLHELQRAARRRGVAAQVGIESKIWKQYITFQSQALNPRRFQRGFDRVNLHRPTEVPTSTVSSSSS